MPSKTKTAATADKVTHPAIPAELLEELIPGPVTPAQLEDVFQRFELAPIPWTPRTALSVIHGRPVRSLATNREPAVGG